MVKYLLHIIPEKCDGCMECVKACSRVKFGVEDSSLSLIRIAGVGYGSWDVVVCRHCNPAPCVNVCEFGALRINDLGVVVLDEDLCSTCKACMAACPFEAIIEGPGGRVLKCDLCGGSPECVKACSRGAIIYVKSLDKSLVKAKDVVKELMSYKHLV